MPPGGRRRPESIRETIGRSGYSGAPRSRSDDMNQPPAASFPLETILVPTDFSTCSDRAFAYAVQLARAFGGKIVLLHVLDSRIIETALSVKSSVTK